MRTLDLEELQTSGVLQEANRLFFHPIGLALAIRVDELTGIRTLFVWDAREDAEGVIFADEVIRASDAATKAQRVQAMFAAREATRCELLGGDYVQGIPGFSE